MAINFLAGLRERIAPKGTFKSNVLTLMTGTAIAQLVTVAISPLLSRLFGPAAFGVYGLYVSILTVVTAIVTLRYDQALMLPKEHKEASHLLWASVASTVGISLLSLLACLLFFDTLPQWLNAPQLAGWIFFLPLSIFLAGIYQTFNSWSTRCKKFKRASVSQVTRSVTVAGVQVSSGLCAAGPAGLICGGILGDLFASLTLVFQVKREDHKILKQGLHWQSIKDLAKQYRDFPLLSSTQNFFNTVSQNVPLLLLSKFFGPVVVGFYALGIRVLQMPMNLVLISLRQVLFQKASEVYNAGGDTYGLFKKTTLGLLALAGVPAVLIMAWGPVIFEWVLGKEWTVAGEYARWLVLWLWLMFANVPAVLFGQIYRKQGSLLVQDICLLALRVAAIVIGGLRNNPLEAVILYSLVGVFFNVFIIGWMGIFLRQKARLA